MFLANNFLTSAFHTGHTHHAINNMVNLHFRRDRWLAAAMMRRDRELKIEQ
ncbi:hypothetical protein [Klebsiella huaxiensis]|uniref:hypothetical protein n=1 Tax=Klebsiella huaxiensis TaxID=2153354 RepID=UPI0018747ACC|nr:hypothetical protein [Klebsiella huaxiensis]